MLNDVPRKTQTRGLKARRHIERMRAELRSYTKKEPTVVRVNAGDYLALTECRYVRDGVLSGDTLTVAIG